jgi:hypothetical protein
MSDTTKPKSIYEAIRPAPWQPPGTAAVVKPKEADTKLSIYEQVRLRGPIFHQGTKAD